MPSFEIERVGDLEEDVVTSFDIALADDETLAAAVRTNNSYLRMAKYRLDADGDMVNMGQTQQSRQSANISLTLPTATHWVTASTKIAGVKLAITKWNQTNESSEAEGPVASHTAVASFGTEFTMVWPPHDVPPGTSTTGPKGYLVVSAHVTSGAQRLQLMAWQSGGNGVENLASALAPEKGLQPVILPYQTVIEDGVLQSATVITACITAMKLRLAMWRVNVAPSVVPTIVLIAETSSTEEIKEVAASLFTRAEGDYLATAVVTKAGTLKLLTWKILANGTFTHWKDATAGEASGIDCVHIRRGDLAVGCKDGDRKLRIIYWRFPYNDTGSQDVIRMGTATGGVLREARVKLAHTAATSARPGDTIVACHTENSKLKLIRFRLTPGD